MTEAERQEATRTLLRWIAEECGEDIASEWAWGHTPLPIGLPLDEQLEQGLQWACAGQQVGPLVAEARKLRDEYMSTALDNYMAAQASAG